MTQGKRDTINAHTNGELCVFLFGHIHNSKHCFITIRITYKEKSILKYFSCVLYMTLVSVCVRKCMWKR